MNKEKIALDFNNRSMANEIKIAILYKDENEHLLLQVKDNGPCINKDIINEIFSPFFTTKTKENNTGLGLYIVKKICERHSAELLCNSEPDKGTTFTIKF